MSEFLISDAAHKYNKYNKSHTKYINIQEACIFHFMTWGRGTDTHAVKLNAASNRSQTYFSPVRGDNCRENHGYVHSD